jgi:hypothetical protein
MNSSSRGSERGAFLEGILLGHVIELRHTLAKSVSSAALRTAAQKRSADVRSIEDAL